MVRNLTKKNGFGSGIQTGGMIFSLSTPLSSCFQGAPQDKKVAPPLPGKRVPHSGHLEPDFGNPVPNSGNRVPISGEWR